MAKPELIAIGQYCLGGVLSFYENLLNNDALNFFDKKVILLNGKDLNDPEPTLNFHNIPSQVFDYYQKENPADYATRLAILISNKPGVVLTNFLPELASLHLYRKPCKTIFYICHDELYYQDAITYSFLIDVYIAHNPEMYEYLTHKLPQRKNDIHYIPYGIEITKTIKAENIGSELELVFLARHVMNKGILDIPKINRYLLENNIPVKWTIFGDGRDTVLFKKELEAFNNITFRRYGLKEELYSYLKKIDLMIHPSYMDGLPVALLEAMSIGVVPILYEFNKGIKKALNNDCAVVVSVGDYKAIADAIISFFNDRKRLTEFSKSASAHIRNNYNVQTQSTNYYNLFSQFKELKKPQQKKLLNYYNGWTYHPIIPKFIGSALRNVKNFI